jgi:hypothetical protein
MVKPFFLLCELVDRDPRGNKFVSFWTFRSLIAFWKGVEGGSWKAGIVHVGFIGLTQSRSSPSSHLGSMFRSRFSMCWFACLISVALLFRRLFIVVYFLFEISRFRLERFALSYYLPSPQDRKEKLKHCIIWSFHGLLLQP